MPAGTPALHLAVASDASRARLTEPARLARLAQTGLLGGASSPVLDRLTRLVTQMLGVPISLVSLVDDERQHFAGLTGLGGWAGAVRGTPLSHSFCQFVVGNDAPLLVDDASRDPVLRTNGAFTELGVVAYAGVPLRTPSGRTLGALCAIDTTPRRWSDEERGMLEDLADAAMAEIELRATLQELMDAHQQLQEQAERDPLTGMLNRRGFTDRARAQHALSTRHGMPFTVAVLDLDRFKQINDTHGHEVGDEALVDMAHLLQDACRESDVVARFGGDEFTVLLPETGVTGAFAFKQRLIDRLAAFNRRGDRPYTLAASVGFASWTSDAPMSLQTLLRVADEALYAEKRARRPRTAAA